MVWLCHHPADGEAKNEPIAHHSLGPDLAESIITAKEERAKIGSKESRNRLILAKGVCATKHSLEQL